MKFRIDPSGPFNWDLSVEFITGFPATSHQKFTDGVLRMAFCLDGTFAPAAVALRWDEGVVHGDTPSNAEAVKAQISRILSLDIDGSPFAQLASHDPVLKPLYAAFPGFRPVLFDSPYECAAWAVMSQRISRKQAQGIRDRMLVELSEPIEVAGTPVRPFPAPDRLADLESWPGLPALKVERLRGVARAALDGELDAANLRELGEDAAIARLKRIPGIGDFWASGIYSRAAGVADCWPGEEESLKAVGKLLRLGHPASRKEASDLAEGWRPYRMWACVLIRFAGNRVS